MYTHTQILHQSFKKFIKQFGAWRYSFVHHLFYEHFFFDILINSDKCYIYALYESIEIVLKSKCFQLFTFKIVI